MHKYILIIFLLTFSVISVNAQVNLNSEIESLDYKNPKTYVIGGLTVSGVKYLDHNVLINLSGLAVGDEITVPGDKISESIRKLWKQGLFSDIEVSIDKIIADQIFLNFFLKERPRLSKYSFKGLKRGEAEDIRESIKLTRGTQVTDNVINNTKNIIHNYFVDKGYYDVEIRIIKKDDSTMVNHVVLKIIVDKNERIKINDIIFHGNKLIKDAKLHRAMKETKRNLWYNIFKASKFIKREYKEDKKKIIAKYNELGYRDAIITRDTVYKYDDNSLNIEIFIDEGNKYYFRNITWVGNSKYKSDFLDNLLGIEKGDVYNQSALEENIFINPNGVFSLYQDNGYLFSSITPVEVKVEKDSIDLEMRIYEGKQARVDNVTVTGNTKTHDHVILREIKSKPGELYSRADITRTIRELAQLGYFDQEKLNVNPKPNPQEGTVDLEYIVEEKPSDQIELSGGWGAQMIVGTLGLRFNNFSARNFFKPEAWRPLPSGDGQKLSLRAQSNGVYYQAYNMSFVEPWLGGKKPNSLSVSVYHTVFTNGQKKKVENDAGDKIPNPNRQSMKISGVSLGLGRRLAWPDDYFTLYNDISYQLYDLNNYQYLGLFSYTEGISNNISFKTVFARNSINAPIYPRRGSNFSLSLQITPPYSLMNDKDYAVMGDKEKYKYIEYHKWKVNGEWYSRLAGDLVLKAKAEFGFLGFFSKDYGYSPFEGFNVGGDGLVSYNLYGMETIALRGYDNGSLTPDDGGNIYNKYTLELRYPLSLNPNATFYLLSFLEAGDAWYNFTEFNPFNIHRSAGVGVRIFLPMFGKLGVDWGYGFDDIPGSPNSSGSQFHFIIGQQF